MCATQVCTVAWGQVARIASGRPRSPSQHTINASVRPRFLSSVSIVTHPFGALAARWAQPQPSTSRSPARSTPMATDTGRLAT